VRTRLVHAAVTGRAAEFAAGFQPYALDGGDWCHATDCARAIAGVQLAPALRHRVYNIGSGYPTRNGDFVDAIRRVVPEAPVALPDGYHPGGPGRVVHLDTTRLRSDTGFVPGYDLDRGVSGYIDWLRAGNRY
jgi:UDP-glucose 4-epimerase